MNAATESLYEPAALATAVRTLAHDAYLALKGPHSNASLGHLAGRATGLRSCLEDHSVAPLALWLENLARVLEHAGNDAVRRDAARVSAA